MKTLIGMREFVLQRTNKKIERLEEYDYLNWRNNDLKEIENYANFLSRQPQLSDFVACGEDGLPLEMPIIYDGMDSDALLDEKKYLEALDKVLFKGFEIVEEKFVYNTKHYYLQIGDRKIAYNFNNEWVFYPEYTSLESLTPYNLELTDNAIKIIGV